MSDTIHFQVPPTMSAIHAMLQNEIQDGDKVEENWISHADGTWTPFYTTSTSGARVKKAILSNLVELEGRIRPLLVRVADQFNLVSKKMYNFDTKKVRGESKGGWLEFTPGEGVSHILCSRDPLRAYRSSRINELWELWRRFSELADRLTFLQQLLYCELTRKAHEIWGFRHQTPVILYVGEMAYLLQVAASKVGGFVVMGTLDDFPSHEVK